MIPYSINGLSAFRSFSSNLLSLVMKPLLCLLLCVACVQAREYVCLELLNVDIAFNQKNVPERFKFSFNDNVITSDVNILYPIQKSVDYDGVVQLKSKDAIRTFHISYEDPGETKTLDSADVFPIKSLKGKVDSVAVSELWGTGDLFTKAFLYAEKMKSVRFLVPLLEKKNGGYVSVGFVCTNWHDLREVEDPKKCKEEYLKKKGKNFWKQVEADLECKYKRALKR